MDIKQSLKSFITSELIQGNNNINLNDSQSLIEEGIIDSLGILKLMSFIEDTFSVKIKDADLTPENFSTPQSIADFITQRAIHI